MFVIHVKGKGMKRSGNEDEKRGKGKQDWTEAENRCV